ncbi:uncharacterized protein LOC124136838 isoform X2 [Haliotis rufescens]|uniref:uncharacterized protein LOC124136838 isoform X2 n=1 Tax=Haliotis rufescens TaxID=6454 RepID=UPI00201F73DB|nr:uncharacterized protein LOC124136838 isoform X2 [Haliotis rufescens]
MGNGSGKSHGGLPCDRRLCKLNATADEVMARQRILARKLVELADDLDKQQRKLRKAKVGLSASSAVGAALAATGFGLSFVTFGASLVLTSIGTGISLASTVGTAATKIADKIIKRKKVEETNACVKAYTQAVQQFAPVLEFFCEGLSSRDDKARLRQILTDSRVTSSNIGIIDVKSPDKLCAACAKGHQIMATTLRVQELMAEIEEDASLETPGLNVASWTAGVVSDKSTFGKGAYKTFNAGAKAIHIGDVALTGVGIILDIGSIIYNSIKLHNKEPSEVALLIRDLALALDSNLG